ncbi:MAG: hypothetical protein VYD87_12195 [Pseudomonadota bacterium]|nr:hypothetical protein [Pseudomonadota bacterium]
MRDAVRPEGTLEDYAIWDGGPSMGGAWIAHPQARGAIAVTVETPDGRRVETRLMGLRGSARRTGFVVSADLARALGLTPGAPLRLTAIPAEAAPQVARAGSGTPPAHRAPAPLVASPPERPGQGPRIAALPADRPAQAAAPGLIPPPEPSRIPRDPRVAAPEASPAPPARPAAAPLQARPRPFDTTAVPSPSGPGAGPSIKAPA